MEKRDMQQGQNQKEILVQLGYSVFNLRMVGGRNRIQGQQNQYKEIKIQIDLTPVMVDTMVDVLSQNVPQFLSKFGRKRRKA